MNFSDFIKGLKSRKKCSSTNELYEKLGGEAKLKMSLRNFQFLESGRQIPSLKAFRQIFSQLSAEEYKEAILALFGSMDEEAHEDALSQYLGAHLSAAFHKSDKSIWTSKKGYVIYTEGQLKALLEDPQVMRLHNLLLLREQASIKNIADKAAAKKIVEIGLATLEGNTLKTINALVKSPTMETSPPGHVRLASRMMVSQITNYLSEEGSPRQELGYAIQLVEPEAAQLVLRELGKFKKWVQSVASKKTDSSVKPLIMVTFAKVLEDRELA